MILHPLTSAKEILGFNKTLDLPSSEIIYKKTLGAYKPFSSSYLGTSSCSKPKAKAAKQLKSSFKTNFKSSSCTYSSSSTSSRNMSLISSVLANGEQLHVFLDANVLVLIAVLLFYLSTLKLLHHPFDKGKENFFTSLC